MLRHLTRFDRPKPATRTGPLQAVYDAAAAGWQDGISKLGFDTAYRHLMQQVSPPQNAPQVLDVGTGTGAFAHAWICAHGVPNRLTLTDISPAMLEAASKRLSPSRTITARLGTALDIPAQDVVLCAHVIEHLDDPQAALDWLHDQLAPGGTLVMAISKPHWCTALVQWRWGNAAYTPDHAQAMLARAGFTHIAAHPFTSGPPSRVSHGYVAQRP